MNSSGFSFPLKFGDHLNKFPLQGWEAWDGDFSLTIKLCWKINQAGLFTVSFKILALILFSNPMGTS